MDSKRKSILLLPGAHRSPSSRFRIMQFVEPLKKSGYDVHVRIPYPDRLNMTPQGHVSKWYKLNRKLSALIRLLSAHWMLRDAAKFDFIIANRDIVPEVSVFGLEKKAIANSKFIFDFDDAIYLGRRHEKLSRFLPHVFHVFAGNQTLATYASQFTSNVTVIPTVVDTDIYAPKKHDQKSIPVIGWMGSWSTNKYLELLKQPLTRLAAETTFELLIVSDIDPHFKIDGIEVRFVKWSEKTENTLLSQMDIGVMPLYDNEFERGKCGAKAIQYMGTGIPALVSPVGVNSSIVQHGADGFHCTTEEDWYDKLKMLINTPELRNRMGQAAANKVATSYSTKHVMQLINQILNTGKK